MLLGIVTTERKITSYSEMYLPLSRAHTHTCALTLPSQSFINSKADDVGKQ